MTVVETAAEDLFVGLEDAEEEGASVALGRAARVGIMGLIVGVEMAWLAAFSYAAFVFLF